MPQANPETSLRILKSLLTPLFHFALRHSIGFQDFVLVAKQAAIAAAEKEIRERGAKLNTSRLCAMTGLYRHEIKRLQLSQDDPDLLTPKKVIWKIVQHWEQSESYTTKAGKPRVLTWKGSESEFATLVGEVSSDMSPASALFELRRTGVVSDTANGIRLKKKIEEVHDDPIEAFEVVGEDIGALLRTVEENVYEKKTPPLAHLHTSFDNIFVDDLPKVRKWIFDESKRFHERARKLFAQSDKDLSKKKMKDKPAGQKVILSSFGFTTLRDEDTRSTR
ncbi:MAG: hypothetical protein KDD55_10055 [Bdellovibrionales bacterium]|nr:hypothetical protein [Bdellovibrionales bacterium]